MAKENQYEKLRFKCHSLAFDCFGYSYIFQKRSESLKKIVTLIKALGILVPSTVGATALGYGYNNQILKNIIIVAIPVSIVQFVISIIAMTYKWDERLSYCYEAIYSYDSLYQRFDQLGNFPPDTYLTLKTEFDLINSEKNIRSQQDAQQGIKEWELRRGMRSSLREHQKECLGCKEKPLSMKSSNCPVCGNFSFKYQTYKS